MPFRIIAIGFHDSPRCLYVVVEGVAAEVYGFGICGSDEKAMGSVNCGGRPIATSRKGNLLGAEVPCGCVSHLIAIWPCAVFARVGKYGFAGRELDKIRSTGITPDLVGTG